MKNKTSITIIALLLVIGLLGCSDQNQILSFDETREQLNEHDQRFNTDLFSSPETFEEMQEYHALLTGYQATAKFDEPSELLLTARIALLNSEIKQVEGWKHGRKGTTEFGFGCGSMYETVQESAADRIEAANSGFEAAEALQTLIDKYPDNAKSLNLTQKNILSLNAIYFSVNEKAQKDNSTIIRLCKDKVEQEQ